MATPVGLSVLQQWASILRKQQLQQTVPGMPAVGGGVGKSYGQAYGGLVGGMGAGNAPGNAVPPVVQANPNVGAPQQGTRGKPSDARFRSFAERFMIARAHLFRADPEGLAEDTWSCILDAKRAYAMIERTGQNIEPDDGAGF